MTGVPAPSFLVGSDRSLFHDGVVRGLGLLLVLAAIPISTPLLGGPWRETYGHHIGLLFLLAVVPALAIRARRAADEAERRFWELFTLGFVFWLAAWLFDLAFFDVLSRAPWEFVNNGLYVLFYAAIALALEVHPHVRPDPQTVRLRALNRIGSAVILFGLLMYFVVLPVLLRETAFWASSLALFVALDAYVLLRLAGLQQSTPDGEWRGIYAWLLAGAAAWALGDTVNLLQFGEILADPGYGSPYDLPWSVAFVATVFATRVGPGAPEVRSTLGTVREPLGMGPIVAYAIMLPVIHLTLYRLPLPDPAVRSARELLVLGLTLVLAALAFAYHRSLRVENRRLVEEDERSRERIAHMAFHDELTGLPNRDMFHDHLRLAMADAKRYRRRCAVLFCDLDRFKVINDSLGHEAGDQVLISAAGRLQASVRELDTVARFGGDEFTIILHGIGNAVDAARLAEKMITALNEPALVQGKKHVLTASMGIAVFPEDGGDESTLLKHADTAMYQAKLQGRNTYRLFTEAMNAAAEERLAIEQGLRTARIDENFAVFYQPIVGISTGQPLGYEALLRWDHPERGFIAPGSFIEVAEQTGLIVPIGRWVLETACNWLMKIDSTSDSAPYVAVNMSARQIQETSFVDDVLATIERTGIDPSRLHLEITESIALDTAATVPILAELSAQGIQIAVDDFGTGFAALSRLKDFPIDVVKVDPSFIRGIEVDSVGETIVRAIVTMSGALDFSVVAEGVETEAEFEVVRQLGCDAVQGYYLQGPAAPEEIERTLGGR